LSPVSGEAAVVADAADDFTLVDAAVVKFTSVVSFFVVDFSTVDGFDESVAASVYMSA
jgi:hypothetical protein